MPESNQQGFVAPRPGDIELQSVLITNFDGSERQEVKALALEFNVYESLASDHLRADLVISDALALVSQMPIIGDETVTLSFRTPAESPDSGTYDPISLTLNVVKIEKLQTGKIREEIYKLLMVSKERIADMQKVVRDYLEGTASSLVQRVASEYLGTSSVRVGAAESLHRLVIPTMTPMETIHFIASEARSAAVQSSNYVFFQDHAQFNFITTEELAAMTAKQRYYVTEQSLTGRTGTNGVPITYSPSSGVTSVEPVLEEKTNSMEWRCMHSIVFEKVFDVESNLVQGMYDNIAYWVDPILQQYMAAEVPAAAAGMGGFGLFKHTAERDTGHPVISTSSPMANGSGESSIRYLVSNKNQGLNPKFDVVPRQRQDFLEMLSSYIGQNDSTVCTLTVPGDSNRKAGDCIWFDLHEIGATDDILYEINKYLSGKYLVTAVRHKYTFDVGYSTTMQCIKNCFEAEVANVQPSRQQQPQQQPQPTTT